MINELKNLYVLVNERIGHETLALLVKAFIQIGTPLN